VKGVPLTVLVFAALSLALTVLDWLAYPSLSRYPVWYGSWNLLSLGGLAAIVVWGQGWAWWLCLLSELCYMLAPAWGARLHPVWRAVDLVFLGLLISPSMRSYVGVLSHGRKTHRPQIWTPSPNLVCLCVSGVGLLAVLLEPRHTHGLASGRVVGAVVIWLAAAALLRVLVALVQWASGIVRRDGGTVVSGQ
jgi:hypothetical protein